MLTKKELESFKSTLGFNLGQAEKDYLQHLFLLFLSRNIKDELIFKGGTALQKVYALNRFSEDLDFSMPNKIDTDMLIGKVSKEILNFGFENETKKDKSTISENYRLKVKGPLFDGTEKSIASLRIEISLREDLALEPDLIEILPVYTDMPPYNILVMKKEEILAEKARTIMQRTKARDVYDLWFLLKKGTKADTGLIKKKCEIYGVKFSKSIFFKRAKITEKIWNEELSGYVNIVPNFKMVIKDIRAKF